MVKKPSRAARRRAVMALVSLAAAAGMALAMIQGARADTMPTAPSLNSLPPLGAPSAAPPPGASSVNTSPPADVLPQSPSTVWGSLTQSLNSLSAPGTSPFGSGGLSLPALPSLPSLPSLPGESVPALPSLTAPSLPSQSGREQSLPALPTPAAPSEAWQNQALRNASGQPLFDPSLLQQAESALSSGQSIFSQELAEAESQMQTPLASPAAPSTGGAQLPSLSLPSLPPLSGPSTQSFQNVFSALNSGALPKASPDNVWSSNLSKEAQSNNPGLPALPPLPSVGIPSFLGQIGNFIMGLIRPLGINR